VSGLPILVPVNRFDRAKGRLAGLLQPEERELLALITLETVLRAAGDQAIILTPDPRVRDAVGSRARVIDEDDGLRGLTPQLEGAITRLTAEGAITDSLLILHADLPLVAEEALDALANLSEENSVVIVESSDGGTNAMLLRPPGMFALAYGPGSYAKHVAAASEAGMAVITATNRELRLDLDTPGDVRTLVSMMRGRQGGAGRYLLSIGVEQRLEQLP